MTNWFWTGEQVEELVTRARNNEPVSQIAPHINKTARACGDKIKRLRDEGVYIPHYVKPPRQKKRVRENTTKPQNENMFDRKHRKCLVCGDMFDSFHVGHRQCEKHKYGEENASRGWMDKYAGGIPA